MASLDTDFVIGAYALAGMVFVSFAIYLRMGWSGGRLGGRLLLAIILSAIWALSYANSIHEGSHGWAAIARLFDVARLGSWAWFLYGLLGVAAPEALKAGRSHAMSLIGICLLVAAAINCLPGLLPNLPDRWRIFPFLALAIWLLVLIDQVYFNFPQGSRWGIKPLSIGLASAFAYDIYLYADAYLFGRVDWDVASIRALAHSVVVPLFGMSAVRSKDWRFKITVSRDLAFHSAALVGSGIYLLLVAGAGYYVRWFGGRWGSALQIALLFCALLTLVLIAFSGTVRARLRVVLAKHFFSYRYDYRQAWLKLTKNLGARPEGRTLEQVVVSALADLVESPGGLLFMRNPVDGKITIGGQLNYPETEFPSIKEDAFCEFLEKQEWIVILDECRDGSARSLAVPVWLSSLPNAWLIVPLLVAESLLGFVILFRPRAPLEVDWEVRDLLKTAGRQAASYLVQSRATEALLEAEKFDSFNRMSAFVVHDLKNIVAQLSLMVKNAQRHKDNPEFQADMLMTVENSAERMRGLMAQLQNKTPIEARKAVDLGEVCRTVVSAKKGTEHHLSVFADEGVSVQAHAERLERIIGHLVQNAVDATPAHGKVELRVGRNAGSAQLEIRDTGAGMTREFIRSRLFKPFQTTKTAGMGIGAYEVQQYVGELGGRIEVESEPGKGTVFLISLPLSSIVHAEVANA